MAKVMVGIVWALLALHVQAQDGAKKEPAKLEGTWTAVSGEKSGEKMDGIDKLHLAIQGEKFRLYENKWAIEGTITSLGLGKTARTFDVTLPGQGGKTTLNRGIFKLEGDMLTICYDEVRPTEFKTTQKSGGVLIVWKRAK